MQHLNVFGQIFGYTGYDLHIRQLINAIYENGWNDIFLEVPRPPGWNLKCNDAELNMLTNKYKRNGISLSIGLPVYWPFFLSDRPKHFIGFCVWEGTRIPQYWTKIMQRNDVKQIWVPSNHVKDAIINTELELLNKIKIIPHGVNHNIFYPREKKENDKFTFIVNKGWSQGINDRGGVQWAVKAFIEEFTEKDKVRLILKLNSAYGGTALNFDEEFKKLSYNMPNRPEILVTNQFIDFKDLPNILYS